GNFKKWQSVKPEYRDDRFDTMARHHTEWGHKSIYTNTTGRNDFVVLKVAYDAKNVYFYARTQTPITGFGEPDWMLLLINTKRRGSKGWEGFNYIVNRRVLNHRVTMLEKCSGGWNWQPAARLQYRVRGCEMELAVPRSALGLTGGKPAILDFKWMDNVAAEKDMLNLYRNGDTAPNGRFRYRFWTKDEG
ncbi:MAG TPA: hypothetical protein VFJ58_30290, partial [Armatimonadota bacterium]|nr:hypothetical protein [Armatimonadota bacterium]